MLGKWARRALAFAGWMGGITSTLAAPRGHEVALALVFDADLVHGTAELGRGGVPDRSRGRRGASVQTDQEPEQPRRRARHGRARRSSGPSRSGAISGRLSPSEPRSFSVPRWATSN